MMMIFMLHPTQGKQGNIVTYPVITGEEVTEKNVTFLVFLSAYAGRQI